MFGRVRPLLGEEMVGCESNMPPHIGFPHHDNRIIEIEKVNPVSPNEVFISYRQPIRLIIYFYTKIQNDYLMCLNG